MNIKNTILYVIVGAVIGFILNEIFLIAFTPIDVRVRGDRIVLPVSKKYVIQNQNMRRLDPVIIHTKNKIGFRGEDPPLQFENHLTIVTIGGSTTECYYLSDGKTWTDSLKRVLKNDFDNLWVNNAGLDGHSTFGHTILVQDYLSKIHPKVAIFLVGANDRGITRIGDFDQGNVKSGLRMDSIKSFFRSLRTYSEVVNVLTNKYLTLRARWSGVQHGSVDMEKLDQIETSNSRRKEILSKHKIEYVELYRKRLRQLIRVTKENGIVPVMVTSTGYYGYQFDNTTGTDLSRVNVGGLSGGVAWDVLDLYNNVTREVCEENNVLLLDLDRNMPKESRYFYDYEHFSNQGAETAGRILSDLLEVPLKRQFPDYVRPIAKRSVS